MRHIKIIVLHVYFSSNLQLPIFGVARFSYILRVALASGDNYTVDGRNYTDITSKLKPRTLCKYSFNR